MFHYKKDDIVKGTVTGIEKYGIFVSLEDHVTGLIHISEISDYFVRDITDYAELNEVITARVVEVDQENQKLKLSVKGIPYRDEAKRGKGIIETKTGFHNLKNALDSWVQEKEKEMDSSN